jgi:hypothetical protein
MASSNTQLPYIDLNHSNTRNASSYTLHTVADSSDAEPLLSPSTPSYGATFPHPPAQRTSSKKLIFNATLKMAAIFAVSTVVLGGTLWLALPTLEE